MGTQDRASRAIGDGRDPMELLNLLAEKRKELQGLRYDNEGLSKVAEAQRRAEAVRNAVAPEVEERLRRVKDEMEQQKRAQMKLRSSIKQVTRERKKAEVEVRSTGSLLKSKAAKLQSQLKVAPENDTFSHLRHNADTLRGALNQDKHRYRIASREDEQQAESIKVKVVQVRKRIAEHKLKLLRINSALRGEKVPKFVDVGADSVDAESGQVTNLERDKEIFIGDPQKNDNEAQQSPRGEEVEETTEAEHKKDEDEARSVSSKSSYLSEISEEDYHHSNEDDLDHTAQVAVEEAKLLEDDEDGSSDSSRQSDEREDNSLEGIDTDDKYVLHETAHSDDSDDDLQGSESDESEGASGVDMDDADKADLVSLDEVDEVEEDSQCDVEIGER